MGVTIHYYGCSGEEDQDPQGMPMGDLEVISDILAERLRGIIVEVIDEELSRRGVTRPSNRPPCGPLPCGTGCQEGSSPHPIHTDIDPTKECPFCHSTKVKPAEDLSSNHVFDCVSCGKRWVATGSLSDDDGEENL
jgi:hypothetical protein